MQVLNQVQRVFKMSFFLFALLLEQVGQIEVPEQEDVFLLFGDVLAGGDQRREDRLGTELQSAQQIFQLPQVKDIFGDIFAPFGFGNVHFSLNLCFLEYPAPRRLLPSPSFLPTSQVRRSGGSLSCPPRPLSARYLIQVLGPGRCLRKYCCDLSRLRDWSTMFLVSVRIVR